MVPLCLGINRVQGQIVHDSGIVAWPPTFNPGPEKITVVCLPVRQEPWRVTHESTLDADSAENRPRCREARHTTGQYLMGRVSAGQDTERGDHDKWSNER
jgi:hypothetical protein